MDNAVVRGSGRQNQQQINRAKVLPLAERYSNYIVMDVRRDEFFLLDLPFLVVNRYVSSGRM